MKNLGVTAEQRSLLASNTHSFRPLSTAGFLNVWQVFQLILLPSAVFIFAVLCLTCTKRLYNEDTILQIKMLGLFLLLVMPIMAVVVLIFGIVSTKLHSRIRASATAYWMWWPMWKLIFCVLAASLGSSVGNMLWRQYLLPYQQNMRLQAYGNVDPAGVYPNRLADSGLAVFNSSAGVDRIRGGCLKNGNTYCIAPIILGSDLNKTAPDAQHELFMVGTDCCTCPGEFRCGDWNKPAQGLGGFRVTNENLNDYYRLAVKSWSAAYGYTSKAPIFYTWTADPVTLWKDLREQGVRLLLLSLFGAPFALLVIGMAINGIFKLLIEFGYCGPIDTPMPPPGLGKTLSEKLLPQMNRHYNEQMAQQNAWAA